MIWDGRYDNECTMSKVCQGPNTRSEPSLFGNIDQLSINGYDELENV